MHRLLALTACFTVCSLALSGAPKNQAKEKEVSAVMDTWRKAMVNRDRAALEKLYAPELAYTHSSSKTEDKAQAIDAVVNGAGHFESIDLEGTVIHVYGNTATVKGNVTMHMNTNGNRTTVPLNILHVWVKNPAGWQLVARQATKIPQ